MKPTIKLLLVEDNPGDADLIRERLEDDPLAEFDVKHVEMLADALRALAGNNFDAILLDLGLPDSQGLETVRRTVAAAAATPIVVLTGLNDDTVGMQAVREGAADYLVKGQIAGSILKGQITGPLLVRALHYAIERRLAQEEIRTLNRHLERRLSERTVLLESANRELDAFCRAVAHDLRSPLRGIDGFSQALLEECGEQLCEEGHTYLCRIRKAAHRMGQLIDDLLQLSQVTRAAMHRTALDLTALAHTVAAELQSEEPQRRVTFAIADGLAAEGDARLVRMLLDHLLGNAWKFTADCPEGRIEFGVQESDGKPTYFVRDNGVGFDMAHAELLFGPFQRLHAPGQYPGTGIGLALAQRIVHRHGGKIWAEAAVGKGATFYFTL